MDIEEQSENSKSPLKKTKLVEIKRKKRVGSPYPQQAYQKRPSSPGDTDQMFKCECPYCRASGGTTSGVSVGTRTEATSHSPSSEELIQDLHNLTLNPRSTKPPVLPERMPESENNVNWQRKNKKAFQKVLHKWTE